MFSLPSNGFRFLFNIHDKERLMQIYIVRNADNYTCDVCEKDELFIPVVTNCARDVQICNKCMLNIVQEFNYGNLCNVCDFQLKYMIAEGLSCIELCEKCTDQFNVIGVGGSLDLLQQQKLNSTGNAELFDLSKSIPKNKNIGTCVSKHVLKLADIFSNK